MLLPLNSLHSGEWAEVAEVLGEPRWVGRLAELGIRAGTVVKILQPGSPCLLEMGLLEGEEVEVTNVAPLGDPLEIRLRDYCLSLRRREAARIHVQVLSRAGSEP